MITLEQLLSMSNAERFAIVQQAHPLDLDALANTSYTGIDLSMPALFHKLAWKSFRKTFHKDPVSGRLRGWNVKVEQTGWDSPPAAKRDNKGKALTFGHYEVRSAKGVAFPRGWQGPHYIDYGVAGNLASDFPANKGFCPLVSVNAGSSELLLGWEVFKIGNTCIPIADFWALKREGPLDPADFLPRPDGSPAEPLPA
jgi:hypothetical protein